MTRHKGVSTFEKEMQDPIFKAEFEREYAEFEAAEELLDPCPRLDTLARLSNGL